MPERGGPEGGILAGRARRAEVSDRGTNKVMTEIRREKMAKKKKRMCKDCAWCATGPYGLTRCNYGCQVGLIFPQNRACKLFTVKLRAARVEPEPGSAPFCGEFQKCNNAEGCASCGPFENWALGEIERGQK